MVWGWEDGGEHYLGAPRSVWLTRRKCSQKPKEKGGGEGRRGDE
jgi:hypothetical protein